MVRNVHKYACITILVIISATQAINVYAQTGDRPIWREALTTYANHRWFDLECVDSEHCLISGGVGIGINSYVLRTSDGGRTWDTVHYEEDDLTGQNRRFPLRLSNISWPSPDLAIVAADSGYILRSVDTGKTWREHRVYSSLDTGGLVIIDMLPKVSMYSAEYGIIMVPITSFSGNRNRVMVTEDGGLSWKRTEESPVPEDWMWGSIVAAKCVGIDHYICVISNLESDPMIALTRDGGKSWDRQSLPEEPTGIALGNFTFTFFDESFGYLSGVNYGGGWYSYFAQTIDGGRTWQMLHHDEIDNESGALHDVSFIDPSTGVASVPGSVARTTDGGMTWSRDSVEGVGPTTITSGDIKFFTRDRGILALTTGKLYVWDKTSSVVRESKERKRFHATSVKSFGQSERQEVKLELMKPSEMSFELWDVSGKALLRREYGVYESGVHRVPLDLPSVLPSGVYFLRVIVGDESEVLRLSL